MPAGRPAAHFPSWRRGRARRAAAASDRD
jgi:hypothetical protein